MAKSLMSKDELKTWINAKIQQHTGCENVHIMGVYKLSLPDGEGSNWTANQYRMAGPENISFPICAKVTQEAKSLFNLF